MQSSDFQVILDAPLQTVFSIYVDIRTAINVVMTLMDTASRSLGFAIAPAIEKAIKGFFEELRKECRAATLRAAKIPSASPGSKV